MTGHQNLNSLDVYIDLAFNEIFNTKVVLDKVALANAYESFDSQLKLLTMKLVNNQISIIEFEEKQKELIKNREDFINITNKKKKQ